VVTPAPPPPLPRPALDSHTHLDMIDLPVSEVVAAARAAGIARIVTVGTDLESSAWSAHCAEDHPAVYAAVAIHPNEVPAPAPAPAPASVSNAQTIPLERAESAIDVIEQLARQPRVVAVGETGLDYYWDSRPHDLQQWWFRQHIAIAKRTGKALMIHDRDAHADVLTILDETGPWPPDSVIFHCFSGNAAMAARCAEAGYIMSFAGNVTFKNASELREAALVASSALILCETDAPYLTPVPHRGTPNSPAMTAHTVRFIADLKGIGLADFCAQLQDTGKRAFGW
jgi:TatD DNase family protein